VEALPGQDVRLSLVKDADHRLSRPADLALMEDAVEGILRGYAPPAAGGASAMSVAASPSR